MSDVHDRFARKLPLRIDELRALVQQARTRGAPTTARARREAHKLSGTAGSYGYGEVSRLSREVAEALDRGAWRRVAVALDDLLTSCPDDAASAPPPATPEQTPPTVPRVLHVDADANARARVQELASHQIVELVSVAEEREALALASMGGWNALIVDAPVGSQQDPFGIARQLLAAVPDDRVPLAIACANASLSTRVAAANAGAAVFIPKPLSRSAFDDSLAALSARVRGRRPNVLVVDDDEDFLARIAGALRDDAIAAATLSNPEALVDELQARTPDALVLDFDMPGYSGADLCAMLRASPEHRDLPIIVVSAHQDLATRSRSFDAGCDDLLVKPIVPAELCARLRARTERAAMHRAVAERDSITGLPVRRVFAVALESRLSEAARRGTTLVACLIDLDRFKLVNDEHGHLAGDRVLAEVGTLLSSRFRREDLRCRWGGEEFALAFPGERLATIHALLESVLNELREHSFRDDDGNPFHVTFSAGLSQYPDDCDAAERLVRSADRRLYAAKHGGRACIVSVG